MGNKIQRLGKKLERTVDDMEFHLDTHLSKETVAVGRIRKTHSCMHEDEIICREDNKEETVKLLFDPTSKESVSVVFRSLL